MRGIGWKDAWSVIAGAAIILIIWKIKGSF